MGIVWARWGTLAMFLAVGLGAFGSHALRGKISEYSMDIYKTAVLYHVVHAQGLLILAWFSSISNNPKTEWVGVLLILGITLFCGSLYLLAVTGQKWLGAITPFGGICFLLAWLTFFKILWQHSI